MNKTDAMSLLDGIAMADAAAIGITPQAFGQWPDPLPRRLEDRVVAAIARRTLPASIFTPSTPVQSEHLRSSNMLVKTAQCTPAHDDNHA